MLLHLIEQETSLLSENDEDFRAIIDSDEYYDHQFFDENIVEVCNTLANQGKRIIAAGLDMDFKGQPFGPMPGLMAIAEFVTKVHAVCVNCGAAAHYSYRKVEQQQTVLLGETESYEARCRSCFHGQN